MNAPWVKVRGDASTLTTFCERCGKSVTFKLPISVTDFAAMAKAFTGTHRSCEEPEKPPAAVDRVLK